MTAVPSRRLARLSILLYVSALAATTRPLAGDQPTDWTIYLRRAGPIRIGMTLAAVRRVIGDAGAHLAYAEREPDDSECAYLQSPRKPERLEFMFQSGRLVRIDVHETGPRT